MGNRIGTITIPSGSNVSEWRSLDYHSMIAIQAPATLDGATTFKVEISVDGENEAALGSEGDFSAAKDVVVLDASPYAFCRVKASGNVGADRIFNVSGTEHGL